MRGLRRQSGIAMVETALVLPLMVTLLIATFEYGRAFQQYTALSKQVRDGARYAAEHGGSQTLGTIDLGAELVSAVKNLVVYGSTGGGGEPRLQGLSTGNVSVAPVDTAHLNVTVAYTYQPLFFAVPLFGFGGDVATDRTLTASVTMRAL